MQYISKHISYADAIRSDMAKRKGINNYFTPEQQARMELLAAKIYEPLVEYFQIPVYISSFFRNVEVNKLIGGAKNSQHLANNGAAIDLDADNNIGITNNEVFNYIKDNMDFDQLIIEDLKPDGTAGWVHVSYKENGNRNEVLTMVVKDGKKLYEKYK